MIRAEAVPFQPENLDQATLKAADGRNGLVGAWFRPEFDDEPVAPIVFRIHKLRHFLGEIRLKLGIHDSSQSRKLAVQHLEGHLRVRLDVANPVRILSVLGDEEIATLMSNKPDFDPVRRSGLPSFRGEI